ncbi:MAG: lipoyl(octanoyl) transferase LipB [Planctomycetes bacterium]|nr:lipoyl(octanoyl) transferase LipB [Planctomycetota bacterium]
MEVREALWVELGSVSYAEAHRLQERCVEARLAGAVPDLVLCCEHEGVVTLGRTSPPDEVVPAGVATVRVERGGEATWHGPGQIVLYPIRRLEGSARDLHRALRESEEVVIRALAPFGLVGERVPGKTGVWVGRKKLCSLGLAVRRWITWHGLALNYRVDPRVWRGFNPCGLDAAVMSDVATAAGSTAPSRERVIEALRSAAAEVWGQRYRSLDRHALEELLPDRSKDVNR